MSQTPAGGQDAKPPVLSGRLSQVLRRYFVTGLATLFPVAVTIFLVWQIFKFADGLLGRSLGFNIPGLGLVVTVLVIFLVGVLSIHFFGRVVFQTIEIGLVRLPFVRKIYPAAKQLAQFLFSDEHRNAAFRRVVLVQYPRPGAYSIAFVTNESQSTVTGTSQRLLTLLIPNPPSPFTGPIIFVPEEDVVSLHLSVEDAVKLIVSGGVVASPLQASQSPSR
ncbi:MAG: DUF502 domain-containing protein [Candidatus Omnitrophica bacterium]|nr:DUF502 domain-containing protein [Candidatus Omnitrophota bacterium]